MFIVEGMPFILIALAAVPFCCCRLLHSNLEAPPGEALDAAQAARCQVAALAAAGLSRAQRSEVLASYHGALDRVTAVEAEIGRLQWEIRQVRAAGASVFLADAEYVASMVSA